MAVKKNKEYKHDLFNVPFGDKVINATTIIEFPLYLKNERETIIWRYHQDGRYECFTFGKNSNGFTYGINEYWKGSDDVFEKIFMVRQVQTNKVITEEEFLQKTSMFFDKHTAFLGNPASGGTGIKETKNVSTNEKEEIVDEQNDIAINNSQEEDF